MKQLLIMLVLMSMVSCSLFSKSQMRRRPRVKTPTNSAKIYRCVLTLVSKEVSAKDATDACNSIFRRKK